ncbi:hypothetical protein CROQUDRAFT_92975 [Cronartium quercuum f. sp. fusiforme G11]|uniref:Uncharacterized protein n=1 Tax=Cronartium quercuum f. sp. fusiforme G11 TaxID=708437 RepID=A0A9P6NLA2_9BASI|nr:hypothetical protein CROQUDRAFT_92975 [Cronartium quercuum f. sp. fusiforme G11]
MEKLRPISGKGLWEFPVSRSSDDSGEVPSSFGRPEGPPKTVRKSSEDCTEVLQRLRGLKVLCSFSGDPCEELTPKLRKRLATEGDLVVVIPNSQRKDLEIDLNKPALPEEEGGSHSEVPGTSEAQNQDLSGSAHTQESSIKKKGRKRKTVGMGMYNKGLEISDSSVTPTKSQNVDLIPPKKQTKLLGDFFILEGRLAMGQAGEIFDDLEDYFERIKNAWIIRSSRKRFRNGDLVEAVIPRAFEKILCYLVLGYLGGLKVMYYGSNTKMSAKLLMQEGSKYLKYFTANWSSVTLESIEIQGDKIRATSKTEWSDPMTILTHLFHQENRRPYVSHTLILYMLGKWPDWASRHELVLPISHDSYSFQKTCINVCFQKIGLILSRNPRDLGKIYKPSVDSRNPVIQLRPLKVESNKSRRIYASEGFFKFLKEVGEDYGRKLDKLDLQMKSFFEKLKKTLVAQHLEQNNYPQGLRNLDEIVEARKYWVMISIAIQRFEDIAPAFVGVLALLNQDPKVTSGLENLLLHGCRFFQEYFSQFQNLNMKEEALHGIYNSDREKFRGYLEFQSPRRTMQLFMAPEKLYSELSFACYLAKLWYDSLFYKPFDQTSALAFTVMPLDEQKLQTLYQESLLAATSQRKKPHS